MCSSDLGSGGITSGRAADARCVLDLGTRALTVEGSGDAPPRERLLTLFADVLGLQHRLSRNQNIAVELLIGPENFVILQVRPNPGRARDEELVDMVGVYRRLHGLAAELGFAPGEWSLHETMDAMAFNYVGTRRLCKEKMEHFIVNLHGAGAERVRREG